MCIKSWFQLKPVRFIKFIIMSKCSDKVYYAVGRGKEIGIYESWKECKEQTDGYSNPKFRKFYNENEAKDFVNFWKNYSSPVKETSESTELVEEDADFNKICQNIKTENGQIIQATPAEPEATPPHNPQSLSRTPYTQMQCSSPHSTSHEGRLVQNVDALALNLRLDSFERRFDNWLKEMGGITSEISHLKTEIKELKEAVQSLSNSTNSGLSPRKGRDGLMQTTLSFGPNSLNKVLSRPYASRRNSSDSDEPEKKKGRTLKKKLSRSDSLTEVNIDNLISNLKPETVDLSSFTVDNDDFVEVYTDGSSLSNGRKGAKAGIGIWFGDNHPLNVAEPVAGPATNITAEIQAARVAIQLAIRAGIRKLKIYTDSEFLINCATKWIHGWKMNGWKLRSGGPVKNRKELEKLDAYASQIQVQWEKVAAHSKIKGNETADRLANQGAARYEH